MTYNWKIIGLVAVVVVAGVVIYSQLATQNSQAPQGQVESKTEMAKTQSLAPTGKVDNAANAILQDATNEQTKLSQEEGDKSLLNLDSQTVSDFGQSVNENEF